MLSLCDVAFKNLKRKRKEVPFNKLWGEVSQELGMDDDLRKRRMASFYNALMLDSRFIALDGNKWDLRERHSLESLMIDPDLLDTYEDYEDYEDDEDEEPLEDTY